MRWLSIVLVGCSASEGGAFLDASVPDVGRLTSTPPRDAAPDRDAAFPYPQKVGDPCIIDASPDLCWGIPAGCWPVHTPSLPTDLYARCTHTCTPIEGSDPDGQRKNCEREEHLGGGAVKRHGQCMRPDPRDEEICVPLD